MDLDKVSIAGNSFGAYIAARYAAANPDRVERLILLDPGAIRMSGPGCLVWLKSRA